MWTTGLDALFEHVPAAFQLPQLIHRPATDCAHIIERLFDRGDFLWKFELFPVDIHRRSLRYPQADVKTPDAGNPRSVMAI